MRAHSHPTARFITASARTWLAAPADGPEIWTVAESRNQNDPSERAAENVVAATGLTRREVDPALDHYGEFHDGIDVQIERIHCGQDQAHLAGIVAMRLVTDLKLPFAEDCPASLVANLSDRSKSPDR